MKKRVLVKSLRWAKKTSLEYHLIKVSKFYAEENIYTVFPECKKFNDDNATSGVESSVFIICSFQPNDGEVQAPRQEDLDEEKAAFESALIRNDKISSLISYNETSCVWKDASRLVFFDFLDDVVSRLSVAFPPREDKRLPFFVDGPDPASGVALRTQRGPSTVSEADILDNFFSFDSVVIAGPGGGCRMVEHPVFGLNVYPASLIVAIPTLEQDKLISVMNSLAVESGN